MLVVLLASIGGDWLVGRESVVVVESAVRRGVRWRRGLQAGHRSSCLCGDGADCCCRRRRGVGHVADGRGQSSCHGRVCRVVSQSEVSGRMVGMSNGAGLVARKRPRVTFAGRTCFCRESRGREERAAGKRNKHTQSRVDINVRRQSTGSAVEMESKTDAFGFVPSVGGPAQPLRAGGERKRGRACVRGWTRPSTAAVRAGSEAVSRERGREAAAGLECDG